MHVLLLFQEAGERLSLGHLGREYLGFLGHFFAFGALGFYFAVLGRMRAEDAGSGPDSVYGRARRGAAVIGAVGAGLLLFVLVSAALSRAEPGVGLWGALAGGRGRLLWPFWSLVLMLAGFAGGLAGIRAPWLLAGLGGAGYALRALPTGRWLAFINPLHEVFGSLWIGTLFVLLAAGLPAVLRGTTPRERRGPLVAELVANFSPLALAAAACLALTGLITAWTHVKYWSALWTTSYGYALDLKLSLVGVVVALGAWNWRRMRPQLGAEEAAHAIRRSASAELLVAAVVLAVTSVLVSLPSPRRPGVEGARRAGVERAMPQPPR